MSTLGQRLRQEREKRGLTVEQLAAQTRIHVQYFEAIERDDTSSLPGGFFYRSFVRQYARLLELPDSAYQRELEVSLEAESEHAAGRETVLPDRNLNLPPLPTRRVGTLEEVRRWAIRIGSLLVVVAVCSGAYMLYERWKSRPVETQQVAVTPAPVAARPASQPPAQGQPTPLPTPLPTAPDQPSGPVRVILRSREMAWVGVWRGQQVLFGDLLRAGETRGFGSEDKLRIRLGNAGGVEVEWNGRVLPPFGPRGQVRMIDFWADGYAPVEPPPAPKPEGAAPAPQP
jgi:transcriptional regulator with XRE-family HTH domain